MEIGKVKFGSVSIIQATLRAQRRIPDLQRYPLNLNKSSKIENSVCLSLKLCLICRKPWSAS